MSELRIAFESNQTILNLVKEVKTSLLGQGIKPVYFTGGFNQYVQDIIRLDSDLYGFKPDVVVLYLGVEGFLRGVFEPIPPTALDTRVVVAQEAVDELIGLLDTLSSQLTAGNILLNNLAFPSPPPDGLLDINSRVSLREIAYSVNERLQRYARNAPNVYLYDFEAVVTEYGYRNVVDPRFGYLAKMFLSPLGARETAKQIVFAINAIRGMRKKCLVLDLDNTLWGGIVGEDGMGGIVLSNDGLGKAYYDFQKEILRLKHKGVVLTICSKNNESDAMEVIEKHPHMVLRARDFVVRKINWADKPSNIRQIASELNIGLDSLVFVDDNPLEREMVRQILPEVYVVDLPSDPSYYKLALRKLDAFPFVRLTKEDEGRSEVYLRQQERDRLKSSVRSVEEFYCSLDMQLIIARADASSIPRIAQLTQKTNQFNLTTKRYTEADIKHFITDDQTDVFYVSLADKFGDQGIVGVVIVKYEPERLAIDTFLLSCRVIGLTVETAVLAYLAKLARDRGLSKIRGFYYETRKNAPVRDLYARHRFVQADEKGTEWLTDSLNQFEYPQWISVTVRGNESE